MPTMDVAVVRALGAVNDMELPQFQKYRLWDQGCMQHIFCHNTSIQEKYLKVMVVR